MNKEQIQMVKQSIQRNLSVLLDASSDYIKKAACDMVAEGLNTLIPPIVAGKPVTHQQVVPIPEPVGKWVGLLSHGACKYMLKCENDGYIFRDYLKPQYGHSGHWPTRREACHKAFDLTNTQIFEFTSESELATWLNQ